MSKEAKRPHMFVCLWEYKKPKKGSFEKCWKLLECYGTDDNGYPCTPSQYASTDRHSYYSFLQKQTRDGMDSTSIMGRAVTCWSFENGTWLGGINPPQWCEWLNTMFFDELKKLKNWYALIEDGWTMYMSTARAAEKMLFPDKEPTTEEV